MLDAGLKELDPAGMTFLKAHFIMDYSQLREFSNSFLRSMVFFPILESEALIISKLWFLNKNDAFNSSGKSRSVHSGLSYRIILKRVSNVCLVAYDIG